ncbi:50S ribosomal protein L21 [Acanthopleuribacter pedis]|uniref:Large ribosomal subunit protein bL21 n=1 Tax=Acanthopleuribacter pedis TaxID=442870 RepID=A0A8J7Q904_9BACT|nr:50S ribosomal protein L21 [Acanthopleuribacter pedis]MBO1319144.1 50S ribosomal protein L21 [Acanthopleuribacter pedis]
MQPYAVIKTGGKQYTVSAGDELRVEVIPGLSEGETVELETLAASNGTDLSVGTPELSDKVKATVLRAERGDKVVIFKSKRRSTYRRKNGHRQNYLAIRIDSIPGN